MITLTVTLIFMLQTMVSAWLHDLVLVESGQEAGSEELQSLYLQFFCELYILWGHSHSYGTLHDFTFFQGNRQSFWQWPLEPVTLALYSGIIV